MNVENKASQREVPLLIPTIYLTLVTHNEDGLEDDRPDYVNNRAFYFNNRHLVKLFAETITARGATLNFQSDWNYLLAVAKWDTGPVVETTTDGKNIVRWMHEELGVEIDPHSHEKKGYNFADVAALINQLGIIPSQTVGGFDHTESHLARWEELTQGIFGNKYSYYWKANILWGGTAPGHTGYANRSGIWSPRGTGLRFYMHDSSKHYIFIGNCLRNQEGLIAMLDYLAAGHGALNAFYTASMILNQHELTEQSISDLGDFIDSLANYKEAVNIYWKTLSEIRQWWFCRGSQAFQFDCSEI